MVETGTRSDKAVGFATVFALLGLGGAIAMLVSAGHSQLVAAWGFAAAMLAAAVAVAAIHVYG